MSDPAVVVAGGGLAGLTAAARLAEEGADVTLFERRDAPGGRVRSSRVDGFTVDRGFQVLFTGYPAVRRELDLDALDLRAFKPGGVVARGDRRSVLSDPFGDPAAAVETALNPEVTVGDKLRTLSLRRRLGRTDPGTIFEGPDDTIRSYLRELGFSERYVERFVAPLYGGITLDRSLSTSKRVFEYTFRAMAAGRVAVPADGMGAIPAQLAERATAAGATLHLGEPVTAVDDGGDGARVESADRRVDADALVVATGPREAADLTGVEGVPTEARSCVTQHYALPGDDGLGVGKRIVLNADDARPNTVAPMSAVAPEYAPDGAELLSATFLGDDVDRPAAELAERSREALSRWFPERRFDGLEVVDTSRVRFAQFAQPPGVHDGLPGVRAAGGRTYLAGDYTRWSSIQGALESGRRAAEAVRSDLE